MNCPTILHSFFNAFVGFVDQAGGSGTSCTELNPCPSIEDALSLTAEDDKIWFINSYTQSVDLNVWMVISLCFQLTWFQVAQTVLLSPRTSPSDTFVCDPARWLFGIGTGLTFESGSLQNCYFYFYQGHLVMSEADVDAPRVELEGMV